jgi:hypothetical protein
MFTKIFTHALASLAAFAVAMPTPDDGGSTTSTPLCCQTLKNSSDPNVEAFVKEFIGLDISGLNVPVGIGCARISVLSGLSW